LFSGHPVNLQNSKCNLPIFSACMNPPISLPYSATGRTRMSKRWHIKNGFGWLFPLVIGSICYLLWPHGLIHKLLTLLKPRATISIYCMNDTQYSFQQEIPISIASGLPGSCLATLHFIRPQTLVPSLHGRKALRSLNSEV